MPVQIRPEAPNKIKIREKTMNIKGILGSIFSILFIFTIIWGICFQVSLFYNENYDYRINVTSKYERAKTTSDLGEAAEYLEEAYDFLKDYEGNPDIWLADDRTNWDMILSDFKDLIDVTNEADNNSKPGDDSYEEALRELDEKISLIENQTDYNYDMEICLVYMSQMVMWGIMFSITLILAIIFMGLYLNDW